MRLFTAIVPPRPVLQEVVRVVASVPPTEPVASGTGGERSRRRWFGGRGAAEQTTAPPEPEHNAQLNRPPLEAMYIPITGFGNVTLGDSVKLAAALREAVAGWQRPTVAFAGAAALEFKGDESVWARLSGDLDELMTIGRGVPQVVQRLGFFVDRRVFRPWLSVGTITDETTAPYLERLVAALEEFRGESWVVEHVHLMKRPAESTSEHAFEVMEPMPLGG
jgi:2'-5' RNA ligase